MTQSWMIDAILYVYALSLLFYFSDLVRASPRAKRMATGLLLVAASSHWTYFVLRAVEHRYIPVHSMFEALFFFSLLLVTSSFAISGIVRVESSLFFSILCGFLILLIARFNGPDRLSQETTDVLTVLHVVTAMASYVLFLLSALFAGLYLFLHHRLKNRRWTIMVQRLPSLEQMERCAYLCIAAGIPLLLMSLALGLLKLGPDGGLLLLLDAKVLQSVLILAAYAMYMIQRLSLRASGYRLAWWNLAGFALVAGNFAAANYWSQFHRWIWM